MADKKGETENNFIEYEITEKSEEALACEWDNYLNDGFDIFSVNNGLTTNEIVLMKNELGSSLVVNEINVDNVMNFSFQNDDEVDKPHNDNDKQVSDQPHCDKEQEKEESKDVFNYNIFKETISPKVSLNDEEMVNVIDSGKERDEEVLKSENKKKIPLEGVPKEEEEDKRTSANYNSFAGEKEIKQKAFDVDQMHIFDVIESFSIVTPFIFKENRESQTDLIQFLSTLHQSFTIAKAKTQLLFSHQNLFSLTFHPIYSQRNTSSQLTTKEISFSLPSPSINRCMSQNSHYNIISAQYEDEDTPLQVQTQMLTSSYIILTVDWFSISKNIYSNHLRKDFKENIAISKEISVFLKKDNHISIELSSRPVSLIFNQKEANSTIKPSIDNDKKESINDSHQNENEFEESKKPVKPIAIKSHPSTHLTSLISEEAFFSAKPETIRMPFESIDNNTSLNLNSSQGLNNSIFTKEKEINSLTKQLNSYKYQNKLLTEENKKLLEVINIFKMLSSIDKSPEKKATPKDSKEGSKSIEVEASQPKQIAPSVALTITHSNNKSEPYEDETNQLNSFSNNQCPIPLQLKQPIDYSKKSGFSCNLFQEANGKVPGMKRQNVTTEGNNCINKQNDKRKKIVQQLESILDNVKNEEPKIAKTDNNRFIFQSRPLLKCDFNQKKNDFSSIIAFKQDNDKGKEDDGRIPFHLISQRRLCENFIKAISMQREPIKHSSKY